MNYELALALKNAGFPQPETITMGQGVFVDFPEGEEWIDGTSRKPYAPSLSELIEAVYGKINFSLTCEKDHWLASVQKNGIAYIGMGSTPEEAVVKLYLALHDTAR